MYEYDLLSLALLFFTGVLAGVINVMAGGGSSIVLPVLIFLGIDPTVANGTNRVAILFQNFFATLSFKKEGVTDIKPASSSRLLPSRAFWLERLRRFG